MRARVVLPTVVAALCALVAAGAPARAGGQHDRIRVQWRTSTAVAGDLGPATGSPEHWATAAAEHLLGGHDLRVERVGRSLIGTHVRGRQYRGGLPVDGTDWVVSAVRGRVVQAEAHPTELSGTRTSRPVPPGLAVTTALRDQRVRQPLVAPVVSHLLVPRAGRLVDTFRVSIVSVHPLRTAAVDVDAGSGRVLGSSDTARSVDGTTKVFDPNPVATSHDLSLRQPFETGISTEPRLDSAALTAQRRTLPLRDLDPAELGKGRLSGPYVNELGGGFATTGGAPAFDLTRSDPRFTSLMAYAHLDRYQRYLQGLGFTGAAAVNAEPQDVLATGLEGVDNSVYVPSSDVILYGSGGVADAEDAEVVLHEYGHAIQDAQVPGFGASAEAGAMGEGFGDFQAAAYFARTSGGFGDTCFADWDATAYATGTPTCLRTLTSAKTYPAGLDGEPHDDGELWSAFLWRVRSGLPGSAAQRSDAALRLVITSHALLAPTATFGAGVSALRTTARALGHPEWVAGIERAATLRGLPLEP